MLTSNLLDSLLGREVDDLVEGGWDYPHAMDPQSPEDDVVGRKAVEHHDSYVEVHPTSVDWKSDLPNGVLLPSTNLDEEGGQLMNVRLIDLHFPESIQEQYISGRTIIY